MPVTWVTLPSPPADFVTKDPALESDLGPPRLVLNQRKLHLLNGDRNIMNGCGMKPGDTVARRIVEGVLCGPRGPLTPPLVLGEGQGVDRSRVLVRAAGSGERCSWRPHPLGSRDAVRPAGISTTEIR